MLAILGLGFCLFFIFAILTPFVVLIASTRKSKQDFKELLNEEARLIDISIDTGQYTTSDLGAGTLISGAFVYSVPLLPSLLARFHTFFGRELHSDHTLIEFARRSVIIKLKDQATHLGLRHLQNLHFQIHSITNIKGQSTRRLSVMADAMATGRKPR